MNHKADIRFVILTVIISGVRILLSLFNIYYHYDFDVWQHLDLMKLMMESIRAEDSANLLCIILQILPQGLFIIYIANSHLKELKENFVYIFTRTKSREKCFRNTVIKTCSYIVLYESVYVIISFLIDASIKCKNTITISRVLLLFVLYIMQMFLFVLFSNFLILFFSDIVCYIGTFILLVLPITIVGVLYENDKPWMMAVKLIPFNYGNYGYLSSNNTIIGYILMILILCMILYFYLTRRLKKYELI